MTDQPQVHLFFAHGDRVEEFQRVLEELRPESSACRYDCWFQRQTHHTALVLAGPCEALRRRLERLDGWYPQPLEWKVP